MGNTRGRWWLAGAALVALAFGGVRWQHHMEHRLLHPGDRLIALAVRSMDGASATFRPRQRAVLINVFATWCGPCRTEEPLIAAFAPKLRAHGIDVVGIDQEEGTAQVARFAREFLIPYPIFIDASGITHDVLGARVIPTTVFIDAKGIIQWMHSGPLTESDLFTLALAPEKAE
jgi:cytochrome c biogenesis protein CcmG/thiol:disulfide interchange protein DsbE